MVQRDFLLRMIQQFIDAVAKILRLSSERNFGEARRELDDAYRSLGLTRSMAERLDESSLRMLVGGDKLRVLAMLFVAEAHILRAEQRETEASALEARVRALGFDPSSVARNPSEGSSSD